MDEGFEDNNSQSIEKLSQSIREKLEEITKCTKKFKENKEKLNELLTECKDLTKGCVLEPDHLKPFIRSGEFDEAEQVIENYFHGFQRICSEQDEDKLKQICNYNPELINSVKSALGYTATDSVPYLRPCLAVFGQTKAGKSSLANSILEEKIVIQKDTRCTARVTYLSHCSTDFVAHTLGDSLQELKLNAKVTEAEVELNSEDRADERKVKIEIRIGSTNRILESGMDIIDSPGLNENVALNHICANIAKTFLPIIIYVIDGRKGVTEEDIDDIQHIQTENPELKMLFFVTKLDRNANERKRKTGVDEVDIAIKRLEYAFEKLKKYKCLPEDAVLETCKDFHGASLWIVQEWQSRNKQKQGSEKSDPSIRRAEEYNLKQFLRFQDCILQFVKDHLENKMIRAIDKLQVTIEQLIEKINNIAGQFLVDREGKLESIGRFKEIEENLFNCESKDMKENLKNEIARLIEQNKQDFLHALKGAKYSSSIERSLSNNSQFPRPEILKQCQDEIRKLLEAELNRHIKTFIVEFMNQRQNNLKNDLENIVSDLSKGPMGLTSFETMLQNRLLHEYEFYVEYSGDDVHKSSVSTVFKNILRPLKAIISQFRQPISEEKLPDSSSWKEAQGLLLLQRLNKEEFITKICSVIIEGFTDKHKRFVAELCEQRRVLDGKIDVVDDAKKKLKNLVEELALQFMHCFNMRTGYVIAFDSNNSKSIGTGGQANVYRNGNMVAKVMNTEGKNAFRMCAMEVYFASRLNHPRVLRLQGIHLERINNMKNKCTLYYPHLSGKNLKEFIEEHKPPLSDRIQYAIEIAEGIAILHRQAITHRDIKLENVLMRPNGKGFEAVVADYGFMKHCAWINTSKWGTPLHIAPEMLRGEKYDHRIDIFSYGILLWFLISYQPENNPEYYPDMVQQSRRDVNTLEKLILDGERPEKRKCFSDDLWSLIESCWDDDSFERPNCDKIIERLKSLQINQLSNNR